MLAADLLASLDENTDEDAATARLMWADEIERRARAVMAVESQNEQWERTAR